MAKTQWDAAALTDNVLYWAYVAQLRALCAKSHIATAAPIATMIRTMTTTLNTDRRMLPLTGSTYSATRLALRV